MCHVGNLVFVFGGTGFPFGDNLSNELHMLNLRKLQWQRLSLTGDALQPVYGAVCTSECLLFNIFHIPLFIIEYAT